MGDIVLVRATVEKRLEAAGADCAALHIRVHHNQPTAMMVRILQPIPDPDDTVTIQVRPDSHAEYWQRSETAVVFEGVIAPEEKLATRIEFHGVDPGRTDSLLEKPVVERAGGKEESDRRWTQITPDFVIQRLSRDIPVERGDRAVITDGGAAAAGQSADGDRTPDGDVIERLEDSVAELEAKMDALEARLDGSLVE